MESKIRSFRDLEIWKKGIDLVTEVYRKTGSFPKGEVYGLVSQMRRAAVSYPSNIAEGAARKSKKEYIYFVYIALGSLSELDTQLIISENLGYISYDKELSDKINHLSRMTVQFIKHLKRRK